MATDRPASAARPDPAGPDASEMPEFVGRFARWWAGPNPETLGELLADDVVLTQPILPDTRGLDAAKASFSRLIGAIPDLRATVHSWAVEGELVFIDFTLHGTAGGRELAWRAVDRFTLDGDRARERVSYFDPLPLLAAGLHPARWPTMARLAAASLRG